MPLPYNATAREMAICWCVFADTRGRVSLRKNNRCRERPVCRSNFVLFVFRHGTQAVLYGIVSCISPGVLLFLLSFRAVCAMIAKSGDFCRQKADLECI